MVVLIVSWVGKNGCGCRIDALWLVLGFWIWKLLWLFPPRIVPLQLLTVRTAVEEGATVGAAYTNGETTPIFMDGSENVVFVVVAEIVFRFIEDDVVDGGNSGVGIIIE